MNVTSTARHTYAHCEGWKDARLSAVKVHLLGQQLATKGFKWECHYMSKGCEDFRYVARGSMIMITSRSPKLTSR